MDVQAIAFRDGRHAAIMRVRKGRHGKGLQRDGGWLELWPLNGAVFKAGETALCDGTDAGGNPCTVHLRIGGPCGPGRRWLRARQVKAVREVKASLDGQ